MSTDVKQLLDQALELPEEERATLAGWLIERLEGETPEGVEAAWRLEIEQRIAELEAGDISTVPWIVVKDRLTQGTVQVLAVAHQRRKPGYWRDR